LGADLLFSLSVELLLRLVRCSCLVQLCQYFGDSFLHLFGLALHNSLVYRVDQSKVVRRSLLDSDQALLGLVVGFNTVEVVLENYGEFAAEVLFLTLGRRYVHE